MCEARCGEPSSSLQHHTFYEFILNQTRGRSGQLFQFDVFDEARDIYIASDTSNAPKVAKRVWCGFSALESSLTRRRYSSFRHAFPANRWVRSSRRCDDLTPAQQIFSPDRDYAAFASDRRS